MAQKCTICECEPRPRTLRKLSSQEEVAFYSARPRRGLSIGSLLCEGCREAKDWCPKSPVQLTSSRTYSYPRGLILKLTLKMEPPAPLMLNRNKVPLLIIEKTISSIF